MSNKQKLPLGSPQISYPADNPSYIYKAEVRSRNWDDRTTVEPLPLYPHGIEFCCHYGKWWCLDEKSRYALIVSVPEGRLRYRLDGKSVTVCGNDVLVIPRGVRFYFETFDDSMYRKDVLYLSGVNIDEILETLNLKNMQTVNLASLDYLQQKFNAIYELLGEKNPEKRAEAAGETFSLINYLASNIKESENIPPLLKLLKSRFSNDFTSRINLEQIAHEYQVSSKNITRMFKKHLGLTPSEFRRKARNEHARRLLAASDLSVKEIADKLGYSSQFYFSQEFKADNKVSPSAYRKSKRVSRTTDNFN